MTRNFGNVVSIAGKFGIRQEEVPALLTVARAWVGKSVDDLGHKYEQMVPGYDVKEAIMDLTDGIGCCAFLETSSATSSLELAFEVLRKRGRLMVYGVYHDKVSLNFTMVGEFKELEIIGGHLSPWTYPLVIKYLEQGMVNAKRMITDEFPFSQIKEAMEVKAKPGHTSIKTLLIP